MKLTQEQLSKLNSKLDPRHVKTRDQGGTALSYVDGHYVMSMLNEVFGNTGWASRIDDLKCVSETVDEKGRSRVAYICQGALRVEEVDSDHLDYYTVDVGAGTGIDKDPGKAHESAAKEAVTDAIKRCARQLGNAMGLALYDKAQAGVGIENETCIEHGAQMGKPLSAFSVNQLMLYNGKYHAEFSEAHRAEVMKIIEGTD